MIAMDMKPGPRALARIEPLELTRLFGEVNIYLAVSVPPNINKLIADEWMAPLAVFEPTFLLNSQPVILPDL